MGDDSLRNLRLFASYSPSQVVRRYAARDDPQPPAEAEQNCFPAAIGFVDVSGFTALSEKLNKDHGRKGAELLNQCAPAAPLSRRFLPQSSLLRSEHVEISESLRVAAVSADTSTRTSKSSSRSSLRTAATSSSLRATRCRLCGAIGEARTRACRCSLSAPRAAASSSSAR